MPRDVIDDSRHDLRRERIVQEQDDIPARENEVGCIAMNDRSVSGISLRENFRFTSVSDNMHGSFTEIIIAY
jgi:hypothetical protein